MMHSQTNIKLINEISSYHLFKKKSSTKILLVTGALCRSKPVQSLITLSKKMCPSMWPHNNGKENYWKTVMGKG